MQTTLQAHRIETTMLQDGTLTLNHLPFHAGDAVEVIILPHPPSKIADGSDLYPLRGTSLRFDRPLEPVAPEDWDVAQ